MIYSGVLVHTYFIYAKYTCKYGIRVMGDMQLQAYIFICRGFTLVKLCMHFSVNSNSYLYDSQFSVSGHSSCIHTDHISVYMYCVNTGGVAALCEHWRSGRKLTTAYALHVYRWKGVK